MLSGRGLGLLIQPASYFLGATVRFLLLILDEHPPVSLREDTDRTFHEIFVAA
jgi:hypothetical protein